MVQYSSCETGARAGAGGIVRKGRSPWVFLRTKMDRKGLAGKRCFLIGFMSGDNAKEPPAMARRLPPLNALRVFEAAARHLSFTRAAAELNVTQTAVSHQIKA